MTPPGSLSIRPSSPAIARGERMVQERPRAGVLVALEEREVDDPVERVARAVCEAELAAEVHAEAAEHAAHRRFVGGREERGRARLGREACELVLGEELRDRRADLAAVVHEVREALCAPLLRELLEPPELGARVGAAGRRGSARPARFAKTPNCDPRVISVASWISRP